MQTTTGPQLKVTYRPNFLDKHYADLLFLRLSRLFDTNQKKRQSLSFGDEGVTYTLYIRKKAIVRVCKPWIEDLLELKKLIPFESNYAVIQYYPNGKYGIIPHRDKETLQGTVISGVSLGVPRKLILSRFDNKVEINLLHGSLYNLEPPTNDFWSHSIEKDPNITKPRMSITFRFAPKIS